MGAVQERLRTISAYEARRRLGELLEEVFYKQDRLLIKRGRKPMAVVISPKEYEAYLKQREADFRIVDDIRTGAKKFSPRRIERDIAEAMKTARKAYASGRP